MTEQHLITPPPKRFKQWEDDILNERDNVDHVLDCAWKDGFLAGADQELKACVKWIKDCGYHPSVPEDLRAARRPQPPSLKEQALEVLMKADGADHPVPVLVLPPDEAAVIRRALEALPE